MAKKNSKTRKPSGAAGIAIIDEATDDLRHETNGDSETTNASADKPRPKGKKNSDQQATGNFAVSDIKKAAAFANSIGGLEKAIAVLQILKVAREVQ
jgi:hypothetical protein